MKPQRKHQKTNPSSDERVIEALKWVNVFRQEPSKYRSLRVKQILDALEEAAGDLDTKMDVASLRALKAALEDPREFTLVGVVYQCRYFKIEGDFESELFPEWVHPYSVPTLMFASKKLPMLMIVNPALRHNKSFLSDIPVNKELPEARGLRGIAG